jgi:hypothetical protein
VRKKPMTVAEMASMGGRARSAKYSTEQLRKFAKNAGRPAKLDRKGLATLKRLLATGTTQAECAAILGVSVRTIGRAVARMRP